MGGTLGVRAIVAYVIALRFQYELEVWATLRAMRAITEVRAIVADLSAKLSEVAEITDKLAKQLEDHARARFDSIVESGLADLDSYRFDAREGEH